MADRPGRSAHRHVGQSDAFFHEWGWWGQRVDGRVRMQLRRIDTGGAAGVVVRKTTWVWRDGHWVRLGQTGGDADGKFGGWHVRGLPVW